MNGAKPDLPVSMWTRVAVYAGAGTVKGILRDALVFQWSLPTIVACRAWSLVAAVVTVWGYEVVAQRYLREHKRQWNVRAVFYTLSALFLMRMVPTYAIVIYQAEKPLDMATGAVITVAGSMGIWFSDRFGWLEIAREYLRVRSARTFAFLRRTR